MATRLQKLSQIPPENLIPTANWELGAIAISLAENGQFADPYMLPTGPTAHLPPVYPYIFGLIYRCCGLTSTAGYMTTLFIIVSAAVLYALLPWFSNKLGTGNYAGLIGGLAGAFLVEWPGHGEYPTALVLGLLLVCFLQRWTTRSSAWGGSFLLGLAVGTSLHLQPALLPVLLACMAFELWWRQDPRKWTIMGVMVLGVVLACLPWAWRNYSTFDSFVFIRSNLGLELRTGNHEGAAAAVEVMDEMAQQHVHPRVNFTEARKLQELGEIEYMRLAQQEALDWIKTHPREFFSLTLQRAVFFWAGPLYKPAQALGILVLTLLAMFGAWLTFPGLATPQRAAFIIPLVAFPSIYYLVPYMSRYRVPIDWILYILAGATVWWLLKCALERVESIRRNQ